jgi:serine O-acetyltransferase
MRRCFEVIAADLEAAEAPRHRGAILRAWLLSPQVRSVWLYRISHWGKQGSIFKQIIAKMATSQLQRRYGCHISPAAKIGIGLSLPHPTSIVIGLGAQIGNRVTIYQNVTIGVRARGQTRYPAIGNDVIIYAGAVLVGNIAIGDGSIVGANSVILSDVPAGFRVAAGSVFK